jgi:hypothetical protein
VSERPPALKPREVVRALERGGFEFPEPRAVIAGWFTQLILLEK